MVLFEFNTWTLIAYGRDNPITLLEDLGKNWDLYEARGTDYLDPVENFIGLSHKTMLLNGSVADLVAVRKGKEIKRYLVKANLLQSQIDGLEEQEMSAAERLVSIV